MRKLPGTERIRTRSRSSGRTRVLLIALLFVATLAVGGAYVGYNWVRNEYAAAGPTQAPVRIQVEPGASVHAVINRLGAQGVLHNYRAVQLYLRLNRLHPKMEIGTYEIPAHASPADIITMFDQGKVVLEQLTIVEGTTFADLRRALDSDPSVTHTTRGRTDAEVMAAIGHAGEFPEGRFFPDTYRFAAKTPDVEILTVAYNAMQKALELAWQQRSPDLPFSDPYQALTLASIVEKETGLPSERPRIAGVFVSRLRKGMRLQSDPTVIYGLGQKYDGDIHTRDLSTDTPYNTYTRSGLPPSPIALPGREAITAAVRPQESGELYFVATGTGDGGHHFSRTLEEHNAAVKSYLERLRAQNSH
jgi:UPF0755 protein